MNVNSLTESDATLAEVQAQFTSALVGTVRNAQRHVTALHAALDLADEWEALSVYDFAPGDQITTRDIHTYNRAGRALRLAIREAMEGKE